MSNFQFYCIFASLMFINSSVSDGVVAKLLLTAGGVVMVALACVEAWKELKK